MNKKVKLFSISKSGKRCAFVLEKKQAFFAGFRQFLKDLGENPQYANWLGRPTDNTGEPIFDKEEKISKYVDKHNPIAFGGYSIELFYGAKRIMVVIIMNKDKQNFVTEKLMKFCKMEK